MRTTTVDGNCYAQHGRDIETVADAFGIGRFALVGWSYGALACYAYLERAGFDRVEHLAILDQTPRLVEMHSTTPAATATALLTDAISATTRRSPQPQTMPAPCSTLSARTISMPLSLASRTHSPRTQIESTTSHLGFWENAEAFNEILVGFLATERW